ncbi:MAG: TetR family transcriptional regulator [Salinibacterium sp.]|nr:TetR family transcriptional regulator [Salinibacterium sp.]
MAAQEIVDNTLDARITLRNEPVQARSAARLSALLDAAASIVDEIGYERLTTAMVAERAGASIGTVYRYFPDRIAVLQALAARNLERVLENASLAILDPQHVDWTAALDASFTVLVDAFRNEPGFRGLRVGDVLDLRPAPQKRTFNSIVSDRLLDALVERFGFEDSAGLRFRFETAIEISDALATRAFARNPRGDEEFLNASRDVVTRLLSEDFGRP